MNGVRTLPGLLGRNKTEKILLFLNTVFIFWLIFSYSQGFFHKYLLVLILDIAYGYWYIIYFCQEGIKIGNALDLLVDGEFIMLTIFAFATDQFGFLNIILFFSLIAFILILLWVYMKFNNCWIKKCVWLFKKMMIISCSIQPTVQPLIKISNYSKKII